MKAGASEMTEKPQEKLPPLFSTLNPPFLPSLRRSPKYRYGSKQHCKLRVRKIMI